MTSGLRLPSFFRLNPVLAFCSILFFVFVADAMMSYLAPVVMEEHLGSPFLMGVVFSTSSVIGFFSDLLIARFFPTKRVTFFARTLTGIALGFPLAFLLFPGKIAMFLAAMFIWGVYYELMRFTEFRFVNENVPGGEQVSIWGRLEIFRSLAIFIAPMLASFFYSEASDSAFLAVVGLFAIAGFCFEAFFFWQERQAPSELQPESKQRRTIHKEIKIWTTFMRRIWPVYLFYFACVLLDAAFWTVGPLISESLRQHSVPGGIVLSVYILPSFVIPLFLAKLSNFGGKKRLAFVSVLIGAAILAIGSFLVDGLAYVGVVFASMLFISLGFPAMNAVFEDYIARVEGFENDLIGLQSSASSLAYILGPITAGALAASFGNMATIGLFAACVLVIAIISLAVVPRKIRLPQAELQSVRRQHI